MTAEHQSTNNIFVSIYSLLAGVLVSSFTFVPPLAGLLVILLGLAVLLGEKINSRELGRVAVLISIALVSFGAGTLRYNIKDFHEPVARFAESVGESINFQGIVVSEPETKDVVTRYVVSSLGERILVSTDMYNSAMYGDEVKVSGKLKVPEKIDGDDGRSFNYPEYLAKDDIYYTASFAKVEILSSGHGSALKRTLYSLKRSLVRNIRKILPEPESSLLAGLVIAGKDAMPADIMDEFRRAGIVHIVVLSGFNITIIADFLRKFFSKIFMKLRYFGYLGAFSGKGPQLAAGFSALGVVSFVIMTGAEATVVRAGLMVLAVIVAKIFGRTYSQPRALLSAAFLMVLENPKILVFDTSFQLSFLATFALIYVAPLVEKYLVRLPNKIGERTMLATTIATQIVVLPYLVYVMGNVSLVSLPANVFVLLLIPPTMLFGFLASLVAYVSTALAFPLTYIAHILLAWILWVSHILGNMKYSALNVAKFPFLVVILIYLVLFVVWKKLSQPVLSHQTQPLL
jgi:competence protein ComEC